jgi:hypothetical protein
MRRHRDDTVIPFPKRGGWGGRPLPASAPPSSPLALLTPTAVTAPVVTATAIIPLDPWTSGLCDTLRNWAAAENPGDLQAAMRQWCRYARRYAEMRRFRTWRTDFRRRREAETLLELALLDVDAFFHRNPLQPPDDDGDDPEPPFLALPPPTGELVDA